MGKKKQDDLLYTNTFPHLPYLMRITVDVKPKSKKDSVEVISEDHFMVRVRAPASKGKANLAVIKLLKKYLGKPVSIISGYTSSRKIFVIEE